MGQHRTYRARWYTIAAILLLFAQLAVTSRDLSLTYDEPTYTAIGYADLATGDVRWHGDIGHPPLMNLLTAWPLLLDPDRPDARPFIEQDDWLALFAALVERAGIDKVALVTRVPVMWLTVLLGSLTYRWAQKAWKGYAGLLALVVFGFDPNIIAHGQLNTTDMAITAFGFAACYALSRYLARPSGQRYLAAGCFLGAALASKTSGIFWIGAFGLITGIHWMTGAREHRHIRALIQHGLEMAGFAAIAALVLWASYLFELRPLSPDGMPVPAASHWPGLLYQRSNVLVAGQTTFLMGRRIAGGHWAYFPIAFLLKTPLPTLLAFTAMAYRAIRRRSAGPRWSALALLIVPGAYFIVAMQVALNIGYRYLLPIVPFVAVFIAQAGSLVQMRAANHPARRGVLAMLSLWAVWAIGSTVAIAPHYLTYFNELAGGANNGFKFLADSSVDWGQALKTLKRHLDTEGIESVQLAAFTALDPALYGLDFEPQPPTAADPITLTARFNPDSGTYAISAVPLQGIWLLDPDTYDWFRRRDPIARVGHVYFVYRVERDPSDRWVATCASPQPVLGPEQLVEGFGRDELRTAHFDCTSSWLYPAGDKGWTVLPGNDPPERWVKNRTNGTSISFRQGEHWSHPALTIYEQNTVPTGSLPSHTSGFTATATWSLDRILTRGARTDLPMASTGPLTFLGYEVLAQRWPEDIELHTFWRVNAVPNRPLSIMAHLLATNGRPSAINDGLGVPIEVWRPGDIIVQRHRLRAPEDQGLDIAAIYTGVYWLDTMERWTFIGEKNDTYDRINLFQLSR